VTFGLLQASTQRNSSDEKTRRRHRDHRASWCVNWSSVLHDCHRSLDVCDHRDKQLVSLAVMAAVIFDLPVSPIGIIVMSFATLVAIWCGMQRHAETIGRFLECWAFAWTYVVRFTMLFGVLGVMPFLTLTKGLGVALPGWTILPLGAAIAFLLCHWTKRQSSDQ
jgi:hypothetical protein